MDLDKFLINSWDANARFRHEQIVSGKDITFSKVAVPKILEVLKTDPSYPSFSILDVGCGTGVFSKILAEHVRSIIGIDISGASISIARTYAKEAHNIAFKCISIQAYAMETQRKENSKPTQNKFNFVIAHMTLHTIKNLSGALEAISNLLAFTGTFVFTIPHPFLYPFQKKEIFEQQGYDYYTAAFYQIPFSISNDPNPLPSRTPYFHRPLEAYITELGKAGFVIIEMNIPKLSKSNEPLYKDPDKDTHRQHLLLTICCKEAKLLYDYDKPNQTTNHDTKEEGF
jgi:2-polyprenyl-3-methyl-5-hydroxy-6-metoxy-1,4-benzoquinol methylase